MKKTNFLIVSSVLALLAILLGTVEPFRLCGSYWRECMNYNYVIASTLIPSLSFFLISLIAYFTPEQIFKSWAKFAVVWVPLSMLAILVAPEYSGDFLFPIEKGSVALLTTVVFVVCSFLLIGWGYWKVTSKK